MRGHHRAAKNMKKEMVRRVIQNAKTCKGQTRANQAPGPLGFAESLQLLMLQPMILMSVGQHLPLFLATLVSQRRR